MRFDHFRLGVFLFVVVVVLSVDVIVIDFRRRLLADSPPRRFEFAQDFWDELVSQSA